MEQRRIRVAFGRAIVRHGFIRATACDTSELHFCKAAATTACMSRSSLSLSEGSEKEKAVGEKIARASQWRLRLLRSSAKRQALKGRSIIVVLTPVTDVIAELQADRIDARPAPLLQRAVRNVPALGELVLIEGARFPVGGVRGGAVLHGVLLDKLRLQRRDTHYGSDGWKTAGKAAGKSTFYFPAVDALKNKEVLRR